jgi:hypothetical protein
MLRITIQFVPGGCETGAAVIGRGTIANVSGLADISDYACDFEENPWQGRARGPHLGRLESWPRNERGLWQIVHAALAVALGMTPKQSRRKRTTKPAGTARRGGTGQRRPG